MNGNDNAISPLTIDFDIHRQRSIQTKEWTMLARAASSSPLSRAIKFAVGGLAVVAAIIFFIFTDDGNKFGIAAVVAAVVAAVCVSGAVTDIALARSKRKKTLEKLNGYIDSTLGAFPERCELTVTFSRTHAEFSSGDTVRSADLGECSAVEFDGYLAVDFGSCGCICFAPGELGEQEKDIKELLKAHGERYQYLYRAEPGAYRLENALPESSDKKQ